MQYGSNYLSDKYTPTDGTPTAITRSTTFGSDTPEIAVWPQQADWWSDTWVVAAWTLASETWVGQGVSWLWSHGHDVLRIGIGLLDVGFGITLLGASEGPWAVATVPIGVELMALGIDQLLTGYNNIRDGRIGRGYSLMETRVFEETESHLAAVLVPAATSLGLMVWGGRLVTASLVTTPKGWLDFLPEAEARLAAARARYGDGLVAMARPVRITERWTPRDITDPRFSAGCEDVARQIEKLIGGEVKRIAPLTGEGSAMLGSYRGHSPGWFHHEVVVRDGRVYDLFTGHNGLSIVEYKKLWECADYIRFGF